MSKVVDNAEIYSELNADSGAVVDKFVNIGSLLRNRRLDMNISVDDTAKALKLSAAFIIMVEDGEYEDVSKKIYYFGYVRNISRYLKLDEEMVLRYLVAEPKMNTVVIKDRLSNDINIITKSIAAASQTYNRNNSGSKYLYVLAGIIIIVVAVAVTLIVRSQFEAQNMPIGSSINADRKVKL